MSISCALLLSTPPDQTPSCDACLPGESLCDFPFPVVSHLVPLVSPTATLDTAYSIELHCNRLHFQWVLIHLSQSLVLSHTFLSCSLALNNANLPMRLGLNGGSRGP
ncbi:hypothetical protein CEXT_597561 [Caerostris extrusa]|uniref:Uncharacterized protein n=1 Tax=Caerostris extrusa TaxID=172846 RepID=A0AAV4WIQ1_CAEEX|nr:hypothetical protein CEXT_597561 [Caerostris extrusa]